MTLLRWLMLVLFLAGVPAMAFAQGRGGPADEATRRERSHRLIGGASGDAEAAMAERLGKVRALRDARKLAEDILKNPDRYKVGAELDRLKKKFAEQGKIPDLNNPDLKDPELQALVRKALEQHKQGLSNPSLQLDERQLEGIRDLLPGPLPNTTPGQLGGPTPAAPPTPPSGESPQQPPVTPQGESGSGTIPLPGQPQAHGGGGPQPIPNPPAAPTPEAMTNQAGSKFAEQLAKLGTRLKGMDATLRDSPALNQAIQALARYRGGDESDFWEDMGRRFEGMESWLPKRSLEVSAERASGLADRVAASLPKMNWRRRGDLESWNRPSLPRMSRPTIAGPQESWFWMLAAFVAVVFAVAAWRVRGWSRPAGADHLQGWKLGPWPVDPTKVRTREDLVRAFEYLVLLNLGPSACSRHHRDLAQGLGGMDTTLHGLSPRRRAAQELADLYEQARYAPPSDPWPETSVAAARHDLNFLAGVKAA
jgi:hypothetical protein